MGEAGLDRPRNLSSNPKFKLDLIQGCTRKGVDSPERGVAPRLRPRRRPASLQGGQLAEISRQSAIFRLWRRTRIRRERTSRTARGRAAPGEASAASGGRGEPGEAGEAAFERGHLSTLTWIHAAFSPRYSYGGNDIMGLQTLNSTQMFLQ